MLVEAGVRPRPAIFNHQELSGSWTLETSAVLPLMMQMLAHAVVQTQPLHTRLAELEDGCLTSRCESVRTVLEPLRWLQNGLVNKGLPDREARVPFKTPGAVARHSVLPSDCAERLAHKTCRLRLPSLTVSVHILPGDHQEAVYFNLSLVSKPVNKAKGDAYKSYLARIYDVKGREPLRLKDELARIVKANKTWDEEAKREMESMVDNLGHKIVKQARRKHAGAPNRARGQASSRVVFFGGGHRPHTLDDSRSVFSFFPADEEGCSHHPCCSDRAAVAPCLLAGH